jgi:tetratricopeptide (TPR) repeat protein
MSRTPTPSENGRTDEAIVAAVADDFLERQRRGERPDVEEYAARHPHLAPVLRQVLASLDLIGLSSDGVGAVPGLQGNGGEALGDFRIVREIGRGGMGVVYEAEQVSLGRRVALKVLPFAGALDARQRQRFQNEARAAALLHHPHIVTVYAVGCEREVHYYAMQLIEGRTLEALVRTRREAEAGEAVTQVAEPGLLFRQAAEFGVQAAEALEYAHQVGIVHRDVKPANLMVDSADRLWVTDFGLARNLTEPGLTMTGDLLGTLRYMSPEQALAKHGLVDHRTDVYALGVTLYELLTLRPAVEGKDREEVLRRIAFEEPRPPRSWNRAIPVDLETVVLKAMAKDPAERYTTAQELADDLRRFLEDRPIRGRRSPLVRRMARWCRRHKPLVTGLGVLMLTLLLLGGAELWRQQRRHAATEQERAATELAVGEDLQEAELWQQQERWDEARVALGRAEGRLARVELTHLAERMRRLRRDVELVAALEDAYLQRSAMGETGLDYAASDRAYAAAFGSFGLDVRTLDPEKAAERIQASAIRARLVTALDDWAFVKDWLWLESGEPLRAVAQLADDDPWRRQLRDPHVRKDRAALERLARADGVLSQPPANLVLLSSALVQVEGRTAAERLLGLAQQVHPGDFWINFRLAGLLSQTAAPRAEAVGFYRAALALRPRSAAVYYNLGAALRRQEKLPEAVDAYEKAIALKPDHAWFHYTLGVVVHGQGKLAEAAAANRRAIELQPDFAQAHGNLGAVLRDLGKLAEAESACRRAIELKPDYALAHANLGTVLQDRGKFSEAEDACRRAIELNRDLVHAHNTLGSALQSQGKLAEAETAYCQALKLQPDLPQTLSNLGTVLQELGRLAEAVEACRRAIALKPDYAKAHNDLGGVLCAQGKLPEAEAACRRALELRPDFAEAHTSLGSTLHAQGKLPEAEAACRKALELRPDFAEAHGVLGSALHDQGKLPEAEAEHRKAIALAPHLARAYGNLGATLRAQGKLPEAEAACRRAIELKPDEAPAYNNLGNALRDQGKLPEAVAAFRKAIELKPDDAPAHYNLGNALRIQGKLPEASDAYRKAAELKPDYAEAHSNLGNALRELGKLPEAEAACRKAIALNPHYALAHNNLGVALQMQGKLPEASEAYRKAAALKPDLAQAHSNLGTVLRMLGKPAEAAEAYRRAVALQPDSALVHCNLGLALMEQGQFADALTEVKRGHELGSRDPRWPHPSALWVRLTEVAPKLPQILDGQARPADAAECLDLALLCHRHKQLPATAVRFYEEAFAAQPGLAGDVQRPYRFSAACAAALAGAGKGKDAEGLGDEERARLRRQALKWLRADLEAWGQHLDKGHDPVRPFVEQTIRHWQNHPDLSGVRAGEALGRLSEAERTEWHKLWQDAEELRKRATVRP